MNNRTRTGIGVHQIAVIAAYIATLVVNFLATWLPINGQTTAQIANRIPIFFLPANYVFSIWGVIYLGLGAYAIFQARPAVRDNAVLKAIAWPFVLSCVANCIWLVLFHYEAFPPSMIAMLALLGLLIWIYLRLDVNGKDTNVANGFRWAVHVPFSIYLGWITVATVANATYVLFQANWDGFGIAGSTWAAIMIVAAAIITLAMILTRADVAYTLVVVWALVGIVARFPSEPVLTPAAGGMAAVLVVALVARLFTARPTRPLATAK